MKTMKELADKHCKKSRTVKSKHANDSGRAIKLPSSYEAMLDKKIQHELTKEERRQIAKEDQARMNAEYWASGRDEKFNQPFKQLKPCVFHGGVTANRSNS